MGGAHRRRIAVTFCAFAVLFLAVLGKALKIQAIDREALLARSRDQILREVTVYPGRGRILDRKGAPLAINVRTYSIFTIPGSRGAWRESYRELARIVPSLTYGKILEKVRNRRRYTWLARKIPLDRGQVERVAALRGVYIEAVPKRSYPNGGLLAQVLGFVGTDNVGLSGVEYLFDERLRGRPSVLRYVKDAKGRPVKFAGGPGPGGGEGENDVELSIDKELQAVAERHLREAVERHNADGGGVGVMDVATGEVLAMASLPAYDPNAWGESPERHRKLSFVTDPIEPGSTLKILTVASALEHGTVRPDTNFYCEKGSMEVEGHLVTEAGPGRGFEWLSVGDIVKHSSNIGTTKIAFDLGYPRLVGTLRSFNVGAKTGIEVPGESRGILSPGEDASALRLSNVSFGQGVATTGIQMLAIYAAVAGGGLYVPPTVLKGGSRERGRRVVLSRGTALALEGMLVEAVRDGTGSLARVPHFVIAGKTSTAQRPDAAGGYRGYVSGFIGYPVNVDRRFVIYVYVDNPKGKEYVGGAVAAPVFEKVARYMLYRDRDFSRMALVDGEHGGPGGLPPPAGGGGAPAAGAPAREAPAQGTTPNFLGLDKRNTRRVARGLGLVLTHRGAGIVARQDPSPGGRLPGDGAVHLTYEPPRND